MQFVEMKASYISELQQIKTELSCKKDEIDALEAKKDKSDLKNDSVIQRQTNNIQQLVSAAQNMSNKIKSYKALDAQVAQMNIEKKDSLRYTELIESRFKEISKKEEEAN